MPSILAASKALGAALLLLAAPSSATPIGSDLELTLETRQSGNNHLEISHCHGSGAIFNMNDLNDLIEWSCNRQFSFNRVDKGSNYQRFRHTINGKTKTELEQSGGGRKVEVLLDMRVHMANRLGPSQCRQALQWMSIGCPYDGNKTRGGAGKLRTGNILNGGDLVAEVWIDINYL